MGKPKLDNIMLGERDNRRRMFSRIGATMDGLKIGEGFRLHCMYPLEVEKIGEYVAQHLRFVKQYLKNNFKFRIVPNQENLTYVVRRTA